ncbi:hypothetical protein AB0M80_05685 [Amycolatopsis sp. NPDC051045]
MSANDSGAWHRELQRQQEEIQRKQREARRKAGPSDDHPHRRADRRVGPG